MSFSTALSVGDHQLPFTASLSICFRWIVTKKNRTRGSTVCVRCHGLVQFAVELESSHRPQLYSVSIFFRFVHPCLLLYLLFYSYLFLIFWTVIFIFHFNRSSSYCLNFDRNSVTQLLQKVNNSDFSITTMYGNLIISLPSLYFMATFQHTPDTPFASTVEDFMLVRR